MKYPRFRIEFLPRYGTTIGVIWKEDDYDGNISEDSIGHVRIKNKIEEELWAKGLNLINEIIAASTSMEELESVIP